MSLIAEAMSAAIADLHTEPTAPAVPQAPEHAPEPEQETPAEQVVTEPVVDDEQAAGPEVVEDAEPVDEVEGEDEGNEPAGPVELDPEAVVTVNGKQGKLSELFIPKEEWTRKTQELAEQRRQLEAQVAEVTEIQEQGRQFLANPVSASLQAMQHQASNGGATVTQQLVTALVQANKDGLLDPKFAEQIGLERPDSTVNITATQTATEERVARLEAELEQARQRSTEDAQAEASRQQMVESIGEQMAQMVTASGRTFADEADERAYITEVTTWAQDNDLVLNSAGEVDLLRAQRLYAQTHPATPPTPTTPRRSVAPEQKKALRKVSATSSSAASPARPASAKTLTEAFDLAAAELGSIGA